MKQQRGSFERLDASIPIEIHFPDETRTVMCDNIGGKGCRFSIDKKVEANTLLQMAIHLPDDKPPLQLKGRVSWSRELPQTFEGAKHFSDVGIEFLGLTFQERDRIHQYIYGRVRGQSPPE